MDLNKAQEKLNCFVTIIDNPKQFKKTNSKVNNKTIAIKDNICTKDILTTASSNTLKNYIPFYDASVIEKVKESGMIIVGKTTMDELGMGGFGITAHTGIVKNPWNLSKMTGGSSAGSAAIVASGLVDYALGSDTGDSVRKPAAWCGIIGFKPTYGLISRYGLIAFASSLDHIGIFSRNVLDAAILTNEIKGLDPRDMTTFDSKNIDLEKNLQDSAKGKKLFYIKQICDINQYQNPDKELIETLKIFQETIKKCQNIGIEVEEIDFDSNLLNAILPTYTCIASAEATSNMSNLTGIAFGNRGIGKTVDEQIINHRKENFSSLIKRRFIIGSYVLQKENQEKYFLNAMRVRNILVTILNELFKSFDGLILPCSKSGAKDINPTNETLNKECNVLENHMALANFGGFPSITIPNGFVNDMPIGINITGKVKDDANILNIAYNIEATMNYKDQIAKGWE